jgi:hypoxanthine phosphoribosyltransferase
MRLNPELRPLLGVPDNARVESWDSIRPQMRLLGRQIVHACREEGGDPRDIYNVGIVVPRGGYEVANYLARPLGFDSTSLFGFSLKSYEEGLAEQGKGFDFGQRPAAEDIEGKRVLVFEDVCDSGLTLAETERVIMDDLGAERVDCAVIDYKPELSKNGYKPGYWVNETGVWVVYPWEVLKKQVNGHGNVLELLDEDQIWLPEPSEGNYTKKNISPQLLGLLATAPS